MLLLKILPYAYMIPSSQAEMMMRVYEPVVGKRAVEADDVV